MAMTIVSSTAMENNLLLKFFNLIPIVFLDTSAGFILIPDKQEHVIIL